MAGKSKQLRLFNKKYGRFNPSVSQQRALEVICKKLGYSENESIIFLLKEGINFFENNKIDVDPNFSDLTHFLNNPVFIKEIEINDKLINSISDIGIADSATQLTVGLELTCYERNQDPIEQILPRLSKELDLAEQQIIKNLFMFILDSNQILIKDSNGFVVDYNYERLLTISKMVPHQWSGSVLSELELTKNGKDRYSFLIEGKYKRNNKLTILLSGEDGISVMKTLPIICKKLNRNRSSFFKILLMHWFQDSKLVDANFRLISGWKERIKVIARMFKE